jgi:hypothetical protein
VAAALCGDSAVVREERRGGARDGDEVFLVLYRAYAGEGKGRPRRWAVRLVTTAINASGTSVRGGRFRDRAAPVEVGRGCGRRG